MNFKELYLKDNVQWLAVVNTVMSIQASLNVASLFTT